MDVTQERIKTLLVQLVWLASLRRTADRGLPKVFFRTAHTNKVNSIFPPLL